MKAAYSVLISLAASTLFAAPPKQEPDVSPNLEILEKYLRYSEERRDRCIENLPGAIAAQELALRRTTDATEIERCKANIEVGKKELDLACDRTKHYPGPMESGAGFGSLTAIQSCPIDIRQFYVIEEVLPTNQVRIQTFKQGANGDSKRGKSYWIKVKATTDMRVGQRIEVDGLWMALPTGGGMRGKMVLLIPFDLGNHAALDMKIRKEHETRVAESKKKAEESEARKNAKKEADKRIVDRALDPNNPPARAN